jgi:radical SAM protein with 4Fe4S-binding SPASM domain
MPMVIYHGYHQRRIGCFGSGDRFMYIDPYGDVYPCPFSEMKIGNAIVDKDAVNTLSSNCDMSCDRYLLSSHMQSSTKVLSS